jgi:hypothetical protein
VDSRISRLSASVHTRETFRLKRLAVSATDIGTVMCTCFLLSISLSE